MSRLVFVVFFYSGCRLEKRVSARLNMVIPRRRWRVSASAIQVTYHLRPAPSYLAQMMIITDSPSAPWLKYPESDPLLLHEYHDYMSWIARKQLPSHLLHSACPPVALPPSRMSTSTTESSRHHWHQVSSTLIWTCSCSMMIIPLAVSPHPWGKPVSLYLIA